MYLSLKWLVLFSLHLCVNRLVFACPSSCRCMWKGGKQTVECINENLITIPGGMDPGTQVLDFSGNNLNHLLRERFQRIGLINLQKIYLVRCQITHIDDKAFKGLTNLVELDLTENAITSIPTQTFDEYPSLMKLTLNRNPIRTIKTGAFQYLSYLTTLELSNCAIELIEIAAFAGLDSLEWLKLDGNRMTSIKGANVLPETLHGVDLHNNPWQCDCRLLDLRTWLLSFNIPRPVEPKCSSPQRLRGATIKSLVPSDLACLPDVTPTTLYLEIAEGKNVSLLCRVSAIPEATVSWWFQGRILQNDSIVAPGLHLYYFLEEGSEEKRSELFIFNTNTEDNGTFICVAENPAGRSQSNYTIRIIVKEEPVIEPETYSYEYIIIIIAATAALTLVIVVAIIICLVRCHKQRRRKRKKERSKVAALQNQQHQGKGASTNNSLGNQITRVDVELASGPPKVNGILVMSERYENQMVVVTTGPVASLVNSGLSCRTVPNPMQGSPRSARNTAIEQNPDLINDAESVGKERRKGKSSEGDSFEDGEKENSGSNSYQEAMENIIHEYEPKAILSSIPNTHQKISPQFPSHMSTLPRGASARREMIYQHHHSADVHLSPGRFLDSDGYPSDYGLPKIQPLLPIQSPLTTVTQPPTVYYRTLPHHRPSRLDTTGTAATPMSRYARETEFLSRTNHQLPAYDQYNHSDIRYTVDGYPRPSQQQPSLQTSYSLEPHSSFTDNSFLPSPPAPYKTDVQPSKSFSTAQNGQVLNKELVWAMSQTNPQIVSSTGKLTPTNSLDNATSPAGFSNSTSGISIPSSINDQKSKASEESLSSMDLEKSHSKLQTSSSHHDALNQHQAALTESPDEGYEGEGADI